MYGFPVLVYSVVYTALISENSPLLHYRPIIVCNNETVHNNLEEVNSREKDLGVEGFPRAAERTAARLISEDWPSGVVQTGFR